MLRLARPSAARSYEPWAAHAVTAVSGFGALAGGAVTLAGWVFNLPRLTDWAGKGISMFPNAAVCAILCGGALLLLRRPAVPAGWVRGLSVFCALVGGLTLLEHVSGWNLGIDDLILRRPWGQAASMAPMRIGVPASVSFLFLGATLFLAAGGQRSRRVAGALVFIPLFVAGLSLTGYWFGADQLFGIARYSGISWQTAALIALLGIGTMAVLSEHGLAALLLRKDPGGEIARRLLPPILVLPLLLGWLRLWGQDIGLYDPQFGTAIRSLAEILLFLALLWWTADRISRQAAASARAEEALYSSELRFSRFMQSLPGLAWIKDLEGRYIYANDGAIRAFGRDRAALYGRTDAELFPAETAAQFLENDHKALACPEGVLTVETLEQEGVLRHSLVSKFPMSGTDGKPVLVGGIAIDITERMHAEQALRDADRRKDEFLATLAHELRNPLAPIRYAVQLLKENAAPGSQGEPLDVISRQVDQMVRLLEDLLDVSRISYRKLELRKRRIRLEDVLQRAIETSRPLIRSGGHALALSLPNEAAYLDADPVRMEQIFANLLNNAAKFTKPNGRIGVTAKVSGTEIVVSVRDNGIGIPEEMTESIFGMFSQGNRGFAQGGLGIGLSLVKGLVDLHGGRITVHSEGPGHGSEFVIHLPASPPPEPDGGEDNVAGRSAVRRRILVADDLRDGADSMAMFLNAKGHDVRAAYGGEEAIRAAEEWKPDLILLDLGMPGVSGYDACLHIRAQPWGRAPIIIAVTGWGQEADRRRTREAGFDHHLVKPVDPAVLDGLLLEKDPACGAEGAGSSPDSAEELPTVGTERTEPKP